MGKIAGIEPIRDVGFIEGRRLDKSKTVTVFIDIRLAAENMGRSVALNATVSARLLLWGNSIAEELTQALACSGTIDNVGGDWPPIVVGPTSIFSSETRQLDIFWHGEVDAKYKGTSIDPRLVGCVIYSMPNSEKLHHSGFVYTIQYRPTDRSLLWNRRAMRLERTSSERTCSPGPFLVPPWSAIHRLRPTSGLKRPTAYLSRYVDPVRPSGAD